MPDEKPRMTSLLEVEGPVDLAEFGLEGQLKRNSLEEYIPWLAEMKEARREMMTEIIPPEMPHIDQWRLRKGIKLMEPEPDDIWAQLFNAAGAVRCIGLALDHNKASDELRQKIRDIPANPKTKLAMKLSGLRADWFTDELFDPKPTAPPLPGAVPADNPNAPPNQPTFAANQPPISQQPAPTGPRLAESLDPFEQAPPKTFAAAGA